MKTIFEPQPLAGLLARLQTLKENDQPLWGRMSPWQMLRHCCMSEEMFQAKTTYKRLLIGRLFGAKVLRSILKDEALMKKNQPTHPAMKIAGEGDFEAERSRWAALLEAYTKGGQASLVHPFFGRMNSAQVGAYVYKHTDHHLRQFGR